MPTIRLEQVAKVYKSKGRESAAVLDIDLTIEQGEFVFFVGSRGSGKSTLLDILSGELEPDRGNVFLDEVNLNKMTGRQGRKLRNCVGKVPQNSNLIRTDTVRNNLVPPKRMKAFGGKRLYEPRVKKALGLVGMADCEERYLREFTFAESRRIEVAKALLHSPSILLLDEITDRVDEDTIWDLLHLFQALNERGTTILMATRASRFVNILRKRVVTLSDGKIVGDVRNGRYGYI